MNRERLAELYKEYNLSADDVYKHKHYLIITRSGIEKIQALANIDVKFEVIRCEPDYAVFKAYNDKLQTFGSAKYGGKLKNESTGKWEDVGTTTSWYIAEMAEKRAMARLVLKQTGFYALGVFSEDESEEFKR